MLEWFLLVGASTAQASSEPVECALSASNEFRARSGPDALVAVCENASTDAQRAADAALAAMDMELPRLGRNLAYEVRQTLSVEWTGSEWRASAGQILIYVEPQFPARAAEYGSTHMMCALGLNPDDAGQVDDASVECLADVGGVERIMERSARDAVQGWRLAPVNVRYCMDEQIYVRGAIIVLGGAEHEPHPAPDPADLPSMCET